MRPNCRLIKGVPCSIGSIGGGGGGGGVVGEPMNNRTTNVHTHPYFTSEALHGPHKKENTLPQALQQILTSYSSAF